MISIQNLTKYYGTNLAVDDISIEINAGEILGLLGPNGAGKTTTMRILTCFLKPTSGTVIVKDIDILDEPVEVKRLIGYLPENAPLYPDMITYEFLSYIASIHRLPPQKRRDRLSELAEICGLDDVMHRPVKELSRGYKQRVGLAHAMMSDPEILVLDEPTAGLDPNQIVHIRSIIKKMGKKKTVILSTHILSEAEATCDRIVIVNRGKLVADGTPENLGSAGIRSRVVKLAFRGADATHVTEILGRIEGVRKTVNLESADAGSDTEIQVFSENDIRPELYRCIKDQDWILTEFVNERQSLEDTFRELTVITDQAKGDA